MGKLIDADAFLNRYGMAKSCDGCDVCKRNQGRCKSKMISLYDLCGFIEDEPTIDAVPVVRCKECVLFGKCIPADSMLICGITDGYCAAGKRIITSDNITRVDGNE